MNDNSEPVTETVTPDRAKTDGRAAIGVLLVTAALIVLVITRLV